MTEFNSAYSIATGVRVRPSNKRTASILGRPGFVPKEGVVVGHARGGEFLLVRWDNDLCSSDDTVHWLNVRLHDYPEKPETFPREAARGSINSHDVDEFTFQIHEYMPDVVCALHKDARAEGVFSAHRYGSWWEWLPTEAPSDVDEGPDPMGDHHGRNV